MVMVMLMLLVIDSYHVTSVIILHGAISCDFPVIFDIVIVGTTSLHSY